MSKFPELPKRILQSIVKTEKKIVTYPFEEKFRRTKEKYEDIKENRELVVVDKYGNRYYQYYSHHGLPTRRVVVNNMKGFNKWDDDPIMLGWLQKRRAIPPSQEELEKMYLENEEFQRRGLEWDRKEQAMIDAWKKKQTEAIEAERKETKAIGEGDKFEPGLWDKKLTNNSNRNNLAKSNMLMEIDNEPKALVEGASTLPGKYIMEFREEDEKWMMKKKQEMIKPYQDVIEKMDLNEYTFDKMVLRNQKRELVEQEKMNEKKKELTNLGKRMIEKRKNLSSSKYAEFRERFKDVFVENDMV